MPRSKTKTQQPLKNAERKNSDVEWKGYANVPLPEQVEETFLKASDADFIAFISVAVDFGYKVSVEPVDGGVKVTAYGVRTDGGFADGVAVTAGGADVPSGLHCLAAKMQMCEWSPENFLTKRDTAQKRFW